MIVGLDLAIGYCFSYQTDLPQRSACGYPLEFNAFSCDQNGRICPDYDVACELSCENQGFSVLESSPFTAGIASFRVQLAGEGDYQVSLAGADGYTQQLGSIAAYKTQLPVYELHFSDKNWDFLQSHPYSEEYRKADITIAGREFEKAEVRLRGRNSRQYPKMAWKVKLDKKTAYDDPEWGYKRRILNLNPVCTDPTMLREKLAYDLMLELGVTTPRARFVHLRINDRFAGLYTEVENPRGEWLAASGLDNRGDLYKAEYNAALYPRECAEDFGGEFEKQLGDSPGFDSLAQLADALDAIMQSDPAEPAEALGQLVDLDALTNYLVACRLISAHDNWMHNFYLYFDGYGTGRWMIIPWDLDFSWGHMHRFDQVEGQKIQRIDAEQPLDFACNKSQITVLYYKSPALRDEFKASLAEALEWSFSEEQVLDRIDVAVDKVLADVLADPCRQFDEDGYLNRVDELKQYVKDRRRSIETQLLGF
ncbi:CotH kinase family protein [bacterium]|nr:CotH kinase family protein [bacterium]